MENTSCVSLDMPVFDSPIAQVDGQDKSIRTRNNKNSSNQKPSAARQNSKSAAADEKTSKLMVNPVSKGFTIPKKKMMVKKTTEKEAQKNIDVVQNKNSEGVTSSVDNNTIMKNLVKPHDVAESTADAQKLRDDDEPMETDEIKTRENDDLVVEECDEEIIESEDQENLEEGEVAEDFPPAKNSSNQINQFHEKKFFLHIFHRN